MINIVSFLENKDAESPKKCPQLEKKRGGNTCCTLAGKAAFCCHRKPHRGLKNGLRTVHGGSANFERRSRLMKTHRGSF